MLACTDDIMAQQVYIITGTIFHTHTDTSAVTHSIRECHAFYVSVTHLAIKVFCCIKKTSTV